jgi:electron transport complex protein RnfG
MTLGLAGAFAGALLVFVFLWSDPKIQAYRAQVLQEAVQEVLNGPDHYETVFLLSDSTLTARLPEGVDSLDGNRVLDKVYLGYNAAGEAVGFAVTGAEPGFQDIISLIFGYDPQTRQLLAMKVLDHAETPGLGDKIIKDTVFVAEFNGARAPLQGVKPDRNTGDPTQVDMITGATISSRAVIAIINHRIEALGDLLAAYEPTGGGPAAAAAAGGEEQR